MIRPTRSFRICSRGRRVRQALVLGTAMLMGAAGAAAQEVSLEGVESVRRATVLIRVGGAQESSGSGFILSGDGVIATAAHVLAGAGEATVRLASGEEYPVIGLLAVDEKRDMALLRVAGFGLPTVTLGNSDSVKIGQRLVAIGAPLGLESTVSDGLLSGIRLSDGIKVFQISVPVSPGSSGGPIATEQGEVVGFVVSGIIDESAQNLNFALPINYLRGYVGIASAQAPTPMADWEWEGPVVRTAAVASGFSHAVVNDSLELDWQVLDGVELFHEEKEAGGRRTDTRTRYFLSTDARERPVLELYTNALFRQTGNIISQRKGMEFFEQNVRTVISLDSGGYIKTYVEMEPLLAELAHLAASGEFTVEDGRVEYDSGGSVVSRPVAPGVLPEHLVEAVIAILPDSLPESLRIWVLADGAEVNPMKIEFGKHENMEVPFAKDAGICDKDADTRKIMMEVVWVSYTAAANRTERPFLLRRPHLAVPEGIKCVRFPNISY